MRVKTVLFSLLLVVAFVGFVSVGITHATLDFPSWSGTWFAVKVSLTGKGAPNVPPGGTVVTTNETATAYLLVDTWDPPLYDVVYCTFDGSMWSRDTFEWHVAGEPENFLALFNFAYLGQIRGGWGWVTLNVKGKENPNMVDAINSASFKSFGGVFVEERGDIGGAAMGSVKFTGSFIKPDQVIDKVPVGCRHPKVY